MCALHSASVDDTPWLQAVQGWSGWDHEGIAAHSSTVCMGLAFQRAKIQLLPALTILAGQKHTLSSTEKQGAANDDTTHDSPAPPAIPNPITTSLAEPSAERIDSLLSMLEGANAPSNERTKPSMRMVFPQALGRTTGEVVTFIGEVNLGTALLTASLDTTNADVPQNRDTERFPAEQLGDDIGSSRRCAGDGCIGFEGHRRTTPPGPDFDVCVVRVIVDDAVVSTIPIDTAKSADDNENGDAEATVVIETAIRPAYEKKKRCSEHPAKEAAAASSLAARGAWTDSEITWRSEAREIEKICTSETFGSHRIHGELACRRIINDGVLLL